MSVEHIASKWRAGLTEVFSKEALVNSSIKWVGGFVKKTDGAMRLPGLPIVSRVTVAKFAEYGNLDRFEVSQVIVRFGLHQNRAFAH